MGPCLKQEVLFSLSYEVLVPNQEARFASQKRPVCVKGPVCGSRDPVYGTG